MISIEELKVKIDELTDEIRHLREDINRRYLPRSEAVRQRRRAALILLGVLVLLAGSSAVTVRLLDQRIARNTAGIQANLSELCAFHTDIAEAPTPPNASPLGVKIQVDSRRVVRGLGCPGRLAPPSPKLRELAAKYRIQIDG